MNTKYSDVFEMVLALMDTYKIKPIYADYGEDGINKFFIPNLRIAAGQLEIANIGIDISDRDDNLYEFGSKLTDGQQLLVAKLVFAAYLSKETHSIEQMELHLQSGDFKTYAEKSNLDVKLNALYALKEEIDYELKKFGYNKYAW